MADFAWQKHARAYYDDALDRCTVSVTDVAYYDDALGRCTVSTTDVAHYDDALDLCIIAITDVDFYYRNEFLGAAERLVVTPLTER